MSEHETFAITDEGSMLAACDRLHDARCEVHSAERDDTAGTWRGVFIRKSWMSVSRSVLELDHVSHLEVHDRSHIGAFMFNQCRRAGSQYVLEFIEDLEVLVTFDGEPTGCLVVTPG